MRRSDRGDEISIGSFGEAPSVGQETKQLASMTFDACSV